MKKIIKTIVLISALAIPSLFASNALAIPSCKQCVAGTAPASHTEFGVTNSTVCTTCHTKPATPAMPANPGNPTIPAYQATPAIPGITVHPTTHSCGACMIGTAPSSVSAHKNVNPKMIACAICHSSGSAGNSTSKQTDKHNSTAGTTDGYPGNKLNSPNNSNFGHSHKRDNKLHRDHDD